MRHTQIICNAKTMMNFIIWIIFGALVGWVASLIMKTDGEQGAFLNIIIGIIGAVIGGWLMNMFGSAGVTGFNFRSFFIALLGAIVFVGIVKIIRGGGKA